MRSVKRLPIPPSLKNNSKIWTDELLSEISKNNGDYGKVNKVYKNHYNQKDVKKSLSEMYNNCCCYCESKLGTQTFGCIEHLRPKALPAFYHLAFDWDNLHWVCQVCNTSYKKLQWDSTNPILDPCKDQISQFLKINLDTGEYEAINSNLRAVTTIEHTGMNRNTLIKARYQLIRLIVKQFQLHKNGDKKAYIKLINNSIDDLGYPTTVSALLEKLTQSIV